MANNLRLVMVMFCFTSINAFAQVDEPLNRAKHLADSILLNRYFDTLSTAPLFSQKRARYIDSLLLLQPRNAYAWQQRAMPLFKQKKYEIGMPFLDSAVKYNRSRYLDYRAFIKCIFQKHYTESLVDFEAAKGVVGNTGFLMDHSYDFYMGLCYLQTEQFDKANLFITNSVNKSIQLWGVDGGHFLEYFYLGVISYEQGDYSKAEIYFDRVLLKYHNFSDAKFYKALCLIEVKNYKPARELLADAIKDLDQGYTINEDNALYEPYPYQVKKALINEYLEFIKTKGIN